MSPGTHSTTSRRTECRGLVVRHWTHHNTHIKYSDEWRALMRYIGQCIKSGGYVVLTTYLVPRHVVLNERTVHERCDATLYWKE